MRVTFSVYISAMKCDLHVHSYFSGMCTTRLVQKFCRESYSDPQAVYEQLSRRGMDLVTLTDHDSIEGSERLRRHKNFFVSEEVTGRMPSGTEVHIGVYDITEAQHLQLQRRRNDFVSLLMYLSERRLFFSVNHIFSGLTGKRQRDDFGWFEKFAPAIETRNGHMLAEANASASRLAKDWDKVEIGGSDAHALPSVGSAFTEVPGALNKEEFFAGLRQGMGHVAGESGNFCKLTRDVFLIALELMREKHWTMLLAPLAALVPVVTLLNYRDERAFGREWSAKLFGTPQIRKRPRWIAVPQPAAEEWT